MDLKEHVRAIPDFPKQGIVFRDVTTLFGHAEAFAEAVRQLTERLRPYQPDTIAGIEARGFVLGAPIAVALGVGFTPIRKSGKLPATTIAESYELEYGEAEIEAHVDAAEPGARVALIDDLIATGGTGVASIKLMKRLGAEVVAFGAAIDLPELRGAARIREAGAPVEALMTFEGH
ncbi:MAG: adenine phosphoribosyltransferase [Pseudomonadota bacterium]